MRIVLEELLRRQDGLTLVSAVNRPPPRLVLDDEAATQSDTPLPVDDARVRMRRSLYRHSFVLTLRGNYLDCLRYLEDVERLAVAHLLVAARVLDRRLSR